MIKLTVQNYNGAPLPQALVAKFDEMGGTIGRADNNHLVLPDPERTISRVHAQIVYRHGSYVVIDRGSNPIQHNGRALGNGEESTLQIGDVLEIGGYAIQVEQAQAAPLTTFGLQTGAAAVSDPFADIGVSAFASASQPASVSPFDDVFGSNFGGSSAVNPGASMSSNASTSAHAPLSGGIPDDWNPFAPVAAPSAAVPPSTSGTSHAGLIPDMMDLGGGKANTSSSLDAMFGLSGAVSADPLANSSLAAAAHAPNTSSHVDPMQALFGAPAVAPAAVPDQGSMLNEPFRVAPLSAIPDTAFSTTPVTAPIDPIVPAPASVAAAASPVLSWDEGAQEGRTVIRAKAGSVPKPVLPSEAMPESVQTILKSAPAQLTVPEVAPPSLAGVHSPTPTPAPAPAPAPAGPIAAEVQLMQAFSAGLGMALPPQQTLTPEFMHLIGQLLKDATQGTVDLLVARAALKREVRADVTMIAAKENNPLKFSPSAEVALGHLLSPPVRGFMPSSLAMRDAYQDLRAHQFAFVAGMRAALEGVLLRFDPSQLEGKLGQKSGLSGLLAGSKKARMWELFVELYSQISAEASDDFHELFGKEFLRAYEAHIDQLQRDE